MPHHSRAIRLPRRAVARWLAGWSLGWVFTSTARALPALNGSAGDVVTCTHDHRIAVLNRSLSDADAIPLSAFSEWHMPPPANLMHVQPCPRCGAAWLKTATGGRAQVHLRHKGWVPGQ